MNEINDSSGHLYDGVDRDAPQNRHRRSYRFPEAANLVDDLQELRRMDEADKIRYAGGSRHNSISRGR
jgi:hypothetical protein